MAGSDATAKSAPKKEAASTRYAVPKPNTPTSSPASSGPTVMPRLNCASRSAFADGSMATGTSLGTKACRAGCSSAKSADCPAMTT